MSKHSALSKIALSTGLLSLAIKFQQHSLSVICYHHIFGDDERVPPDFYDLGETHYASAFKKQIQWLNRNTHVLSMDDLLQILAGETTIKGPYSMITFDDGYLNNYKQAFPLLKSEGVPATFFIPAGLINDRRLGWWDEIAYLVHHSKKDSIEVVNKHFKLGNHAGSTMNQLNELVQFDSSLDLEHFFTDLSEVCEVERPGSDVADKQLMTWAHLKEMSQQGMNISSHTLTHEVLSRISEEKQHHELETSKRLIEKEIQKPVEALAYPVGTHKHFTETTKQLAEQVGYKVAFSFCTGSTNHCQKLSPFDIKRASARHTLHETISPIALPVIFDRYY